MSYLPKISNCICGCKADKDKSRKIFGGGVGRYVYCTGCTQRSAQFKTFLEAIDAWNRTQVLLGE